MVSFRDILSGLKKLELDPSTPVIAHASLSAFGQVRGGAEALLGALLAAFEPVMMPVFTYKTMLVPEDGPDENGIHYGSGRDQNRMAEFFTPNMTADRLMGVVPEALRTLPASDRSCHPILSFAGVNVGAALAMQTIDHPFGPIQSLVEQDGWVLLLGVDHTCNTSIHYAEQVAGMKTFVRWALTPRGVVECPNWPGCSDGFEQASPFLVNITRRVIIGEAAVQAIPLQPMVEILVELLRANPGELLCSEPSCGRCFARRNEHQIYAIL